MQAFLHSLGPVGAVEGAVLDGLGDVARQDLFRVFEVGDGARDAQDAVVGAGGEAELGDGVFHLLFAFAVELAEAAQGARSHLGVAELAERLQAPALALARREDAFADDGRFLGLLVLRQLLVFHRRHLDVQVDAVEQRPGDPRQVALDQRRRAGALVQRIAEKAALAGIHGRRQHEARRKGQRHRRPADRDLAVLERLAQHVEHVALEFGQLVQKQDAVVRQADFAGTRQRAAADQPRIGNGVVRRAERPGADQSVLLREQARDGVDLGGLDRFVEAHRRQDRRQPPRQHGLARSRAAR